VDPSGQLIDLKSISVGEHYFKLLSHALSRYLAHCWILPEGGERSAGVQIIILNASICDGVAETTIALDKASIPMFRPLGGWRVGCFMGYNTRSAMGSLE